MSAQITKMTLALALAAGFFASACSDKPLGPEPRVYDSQISPASQATDDVVTPASFVPSSFEGFPPVGTTARCPVMKDEFKVKADSPRSVHDGKTYVFCCPSCKPAFDSNPAEYIDT